MKHTIMYGVVSLCLALSLSPAWGFNKAGRTAFQFVKIGVGARQTAIGEASISAFRDVNMAFWNPAAISGIGDVEASFSYNRWFADLNYLAGGVGVRWKDVGVFALSYGFLGYGDLQEAYVVNIDPGNQSADTRTGATFTGSDMLVGLSYTREFTENLAIGVSVKYLSEKLWEYSVGVLAFDVGTYYDTQFKGIRFAMCAQNFARSVKFLEQSDREGGYDIPLLYRIGASIDLISSGDAFLDAGDAHKLMVAVEAVNTNDYGERWNVGGEYTFGGFLALRAGYRFNFDEGDVSFGLGLQKEFSGVAIHLDYSYVHYEFLESPHRVTLSFGW